MTHGLKLSKASLRKAASLLEGQRDVDLVPLQITLAKPPFPVQPASAAPEPAWEADDRYLHLEELQDTPAAELVFPTEWSGSLISGDLTERHDSELKQKLSFINKAATPFAGKNLLDQLAKSLELYNTDSERSKEYLEKYLASHPLLLLAMYRNTKSQNMLEALQRYPALEALLNHEEKAQVEGVAASALEPAEMWEEMKETKGCCSEAMDKLMALTGIKKVKATAVALYKSALQFKKMSPEMQKANAMALNYCFLGNPGTGKTTVARLFAAVLHDSQLRSQNVFQECGAQKVKDDGIDEFRKLAQAAMDGVLFIDEAYDLDPLGDKFKGAPIVNELVTLTENERDRLTVILAGYEDMNQKGFGNAREVRKKIETATAVAMSREDFEPSSMILRFADVELITVCGTNYQRELDGQAPLPVFLNRLFLGNPGTGKTTCASMYGEILKHLGFLTSGEVVFKTAGDMGGAVVGEAQQKVLSILQSAAGKVLVIDEAYNLDDNLYGKQVLDVLVEKIQGTENDDIAELMEILRLNCKQKDLKPSIEFQEKALRKLGMLRQSSANFGNAGAVENLLKSAMLKASAQGNGLALQPDDIDVGPEADLHEAERCKAFCSTPSPSFVP
eukprot:g17942.t1